MQRTTMTLVAAIAIVLPGCTSSPRAFTPSLATPPADQVAFEDAYASCQQQLADGKLKESDRLASGGAGAAAGAATAAVGTGTAAAVAGYGGMAVFGATIVALPFVAVAGAWGLAKKKRLKKEKKIQTLVGQCLADGGYTVSDWSRAKKTSR